MRVGLLGVGAIGNFVLNAIARGSIPHAELVAVVARSLTPERLAEVRALTSAPYSTEPMDLVSVGAELVVEAAGVGAARDHAEALVEAGCDLLLMSVGCLADATFRARLEAAARRSGSSVHVPAGALAGLDAVQAAAVGAVTEITLTTTKAPGALSGAPHLVSKGDDLTGITGPTIVFEGDAIAAIAGFPNNANVAVALGLAAGDTGAVKVSIVADPNALATQHEVRLTGEFGSIHTSVRTRPSTYNARTSQLAALSAVAALRRICSPIKIG
jgi:aspartate dehydrogenase